MLSLLNRLVSRDPFVLTQKKYADEHLSQEMQQLLGHAWQIEQHLLQDTHYGAVRDYCYMHLPLEGIECIPKNKTSLLDALYAKVNALIQPLLTHFPYREHIRPLSQTNGVAPFATSLENSLLRHRLVTTEKYLKRSDCALHEKREALVAIDTYIPNFSTKVLSSPEGQLERFYDRIDEWASVDLNLGHLYELDHKIYDFSSHPTKAEDFEFGKRHRHDNMETYLNAIDYCQAERRWIENAVPADDQNLTQEQWNRVDQLIFDKVQPKEHYWGWGRENRLAAGEDFLREAMAQVRAEGSQGSPEGASPSE